MTCFFCPEILPKINYGIVIVFKNEIKFVNELKVWDDKEYFHFPNYCIHPNISIKKRLESLLIYLFLLIYVNLFAGKKKGKIPLMIHLLDRLVPQNY